MCCPILLIAFFGPRAVLVYLWLVTNYLNGVFQSVLWPIVGFLFMPYTTLAYAVAMHNGGLTNIWLVVMVLAVIMDIGVHGGSTREHRRRRTDSQ